MRADEMRETLSLHETVKEKLNLLRSIQSSSMLHMFIVSGSIRVGVPLDAKEICRNEITRLHHLQKNLERELNITN